MICTAQDSSQGIDLGNSVVISAIGLADDTVLAANKLSNLRNILNLTKVYCEKYGVTLCPAKTKLVMFSKVHPMSLEVYNPIIIDGRQIDLSQEAEHVGVVRSIEGNLPHILGRISSHYKALGATLFAGTARNRRVKLEKLYGSLLVGLVLLFLEKNSLCSLLSWRQSACPSCNTPENVRTICYDCPTPKQSTK